MAAFTATWSVTTERFGDGEVLSGLPSATTAFEGVVAKKRSTPTAQVSAAG
jgi:hypothetical protein